MKKGILPILLVLLLFNACSNKHENKTIINYELNKHDSLTKIFTTSTSAPYYFILKIKRTSNDNEKEVCTQTSEFGRLLKENNMTKNLFFDANNNPFIIDSNDVFASTYQLKSYNINLVDSLTQNLIPLIINQILNEAKLGKYNTLQRYDKLYDKYFIHAILRQKVKVYHDCESGYLIIHSK